VGVSADKEQVVKRRRKMTSLLEKIVVLDIGTRE
jgi:hypothetical protein